MTAEKCWLCLRVNPKRILQTTRQLFTNLKQAHEVGKEASKLLRQAYLKNPTALCGRKAGALIAAAIRLASMKLYAENRLPEIPTQRQLANLCNITEHTVRVNEHYLANLLGIKPTSRKPFHEWQLSKIINVNEQLEDVKKSTLYMFICPHCGKTKWLLRRKYRSGRELTFRISKREAEDLMEA